MEIDPIGIFRCSKKNPYEAARQGSIDTASEVGEIHLNPGQNFEQALDDIEGFSHLWLIYQFHHNSGWHPKVLPPRGSSHKIGVFATRSPYRPNALGLSCVELLERRGLVIKVRGFDLLDETPIYDIKPYLPYSDSFPEASKGWLESVDSEKFTVSFSNEAEQALTWLSARGLDQLQNFILQQLQFDPLDKNKKRLMDITTSGATLAYRTWRVHFTVSGQSIMISGISSGYHTQELDQTDDKYQDKSLHRSFLRR